MRASRTDITVFAAPGLLALGLFYSLAFHMHRSLRGWPAGIGEAGFSPGLLAHATVATSYFWILLLASGFLWPVAMLVCLLVSRWRHRVMPLVLYAVVFLLCILLMRLAPGPYLDWWMD